MLSESEIKEIVKESVDELIKEIKEENVNKTVPSLELQTNIQIQKADNGYVLCGYSSTGNINPFIASSFDDLVKRLEELIV